MSTLSKSKVPPVWTPIIYRQSSQPCQGAVSLWADQSSASLSALTETTWSDDTAQCTLLSVSGALSLMLNFSPSLLFYLCHFLLLSIFLPLQSISIHQFSSVHGFNCNIFIPCNVFHLRCSTILYVYLFGFFRNICWKKKSLLLFLQYLNVFLIISNSCNFPKLNIDVHIWFYSALSHDYIKPICDYQFHEKLATIGNKSSLIVRELFLKQPEIEKKREK